MSEGMHSISPNAGRRSRNRFVVIAASTVVAAVAAGVAIQFFRAPAGTAGEDAGAASTAAPKAARPQSGSDVVARVGKISITRSMVEKECTARFGTEVLEKMINRAIIENACHERGIEVSQDEVGKEVSDIAKKFNLDVRGWLDMLKAERGITPEQYAYDIIWPMLALKKLAGSEIVITEKDMKEAFIRDYGPRVECKMIMLDNIRRAQEVWKKASETPEEFGRLAREHSMEPTSRALDGDVPPIRAYSGNRTIEEAAFKLKKEEVSGIIEVGTPQAKRYVILFCKGRTAQVVKDMESVREELYSRLKEEKTQEAVAKVFEQIKSEVRVDNLAKGTTTGGPDAASIRQTSGSDTIRPKSPETPRVGAGSRTQPN